MRGSDSDYIFGRLLILFILATVTVLFFVSCDMVINPEQTVEKVTEYVYKTTKTDDVGYGDVDVSNYKIPVSISGSNQNKLFIASISDTSGLSDIHYKWTENSVEISDSDNALIDYIPDEPGDKVIDCICTAIYKGQTVTGQSNILELTYTAEDIARLKGSE